MFRLKRIDALIVAQMVQLVLVLDPNFLLPGLLFLIVRGSRQPLQSSLLFNASVVDVPVLSSPAQVQHAK